MVATLCSAKTNDTFWSSRPHYDLIFGKAGPIQSTYFGSYSILQHGDDYEAHLRSCY